MNGVRLASSVLLLIGALAATRLAVTPLAAVAAVSAAAHGVVARELRRTLHAGIPVLLFATTVSALQWLNGTLDAVLPLRIVAVFLLSTLAMRIAPWPWLAFHLSPRSALYLAGLYLLFVRHFTEILMSETRRTLQARALCAPSLFRAGGFPSLASALAAILCRALARAERFYAAQSLNGMLR